MEPPKLGTMSKVGCKRIQEGVIVSQVEARPVAGEVLFRRRSPKIGRPATPESIEGRLPSQASEKMRTCDTIGLHLRRFVA